MLRTSVGSLLTCLILIFTVGLSKSYAASGITYHGRLLDPSGNPVLSNVQFRLQIRTPGIEDCLLYEEIQTQDLSATNGLFAIALGDGSGSRQDAYAWSLFDSLSNRKAFSSLVDCTGASAYTPNPQDNRRFKVSFNDGTLVLGTWEDLPTQVINYIPMSIESYAIGGFPASSLLRVETAGTLGNISPLSNTEYNALMDLAGGTSTAYQRSGERNGSSPPALSAGQSFVSNGSGGWSAVTPITSETDPGVAAFAKTALPTCIAGNFLRNNGSGALECATPAGGGGGGAGSALDDGQIWVGDSSNLAAQRHLGLGDIKTSLGVPQIPTACADHQTMTWSSLTDVLQCTDIEIAHTKVTGLGTVVTLNTGTTNGTVPVIGVGDRLPSSIMPSLSGSGVTNVASGNISSTTVQNAINELDDEKLSKSGDTMGGDLNLGNHEITNATKISAETVTLANGIKIGTVSTACDGTTEGTIRYNSTSKKMEFCNGSVWGNISSGTVASLSIGSPSSSLVKTGPVTFLVTYGSGTDDATIGLSSGNITLGGTDPAGCAVTSVTGSGLSRTVTVNNCTGTGTVTLSIAAGTATSTTGESASAAGPSSAFNVDNAGPNAPTSLALGSVPNDLVSTPTISYTSASDVGGSSIDYHEVRILKTSDSSVVKDWATHVSGSSAGSVTLDSATEYTAQVRAVDSLGNVGSIASSNWTSVTAITCPTDYIPVPALAGYTTSDFCVAKYEAKQSGAVAISQATGIPWGSINRDSAITACQANGTGYDLISNAEWQTVARNIENVASNWSSGAVGSGSISRGHSDNSPGSALAANASDTNACEGTGQTCSDTVWDTQRRTHVLNNSQVIWDLAGNVWEWVKENNSTNYGADAYFSQITTITHTTTGTIGGKVAAAKEQFGPSGNYVSLNSGEYGGLGKGFLNYGSGAIRRGGARNSDVDSGAFAAGLNYNSTFTATYIGFRCVFHP